MASEVLLEISRDEKQRAWLESEYKYAVDQQSDLVSARREGLAKGKVEGWAEGRAEGRAQGRVEGEQLGLEKGERLGLEKTARRLRAMGLSPEQIAEATGLKLED
jgi:predicted transposase YdaD